MPIPTQVLTLFTQWFETAKKSEADHHAVSLATIGLDGFPNQRIVFIKSYDAEGFGFFTNSHSTKGQELLANPKACLNFYWKSLYRQIRIQGTVIKVPDLESDAYFASRPRESQIGAWASLQSQVIEESLATRVEHFTQVYAGQEVPRPPHWFGFKLIPHRIEFWTGKEHRLHDRQVFDAQNSWKETHTYP